MDNVSSSQLYKTQGNRSITHQLHEAYNMNMNGLKKELPVH